ncbi:hypothetical protein D9Q98_004269 [Chlorella vulgaris]|uniref:Uncharacterized protein n=1 Tax=Chlorella vulgaris TaxID=3077 RepID=A0A9D4TRY6_CHLVU|nr:hypothetical protein D9Q98_004269 [Chlorella vulgaris]
MQLHPGWVGVMQSRYLNALGCLWFNRTQVKHALHCILVAKRIRDHAGADDADAQLGLGVREGRAACGAGAGPDCRGRLKVAPWDGCLKCYNLAENLGWECGYGV